MTRPLRWVFTSLNSKDSGWLVSTSFLLTTPSPLASMSGTFTWYSLALEIGGCTELTVTGPDSRIDGVFMEPLQEKRAVRRPQPGQGKPRMNRGRAVQL